MDLKKNLIRELICTILTEEIELRNFKFLNISYNKLELYDNKRIMEMNKRLIKKEFVILTDGIFDIIENIILEEIFEKENEELLDLFMQYYLSRVPEVKTIFEKTGGDYEKYMSAFKRKADSNDVIAKAYIILYYTLHIENEETLINELYWEYRTTFIEKKDIKQKSYIQILEEQWDLENLNENKLYQKYIKKQRKILAEYLEIAPSEIEEYIINISAVTKNYLDDGWGVYEEKDELSTLQGHLFGWIEESLFKIMDKYKITTDCIVGTANHSYKTIIKENFENLCGALIFSKYIEYAENGKNFTLSMINTQASIENVQAFYVGLVASFYFELIVKEVVKALEKYYQVFSFDKMYGVNREKELIEKNRILKNEVKSYKDRLSQYADEDFENRKKQYSEKNSDNRVYVEQINLIKKQLDAQKKENKKCQDRLKLQEEYIELLESRVETEPYTDVIDSSLLINKKLVFIGGKQGVLAKLQMLLPKSVFINDEAVAPPQIIDAIVMFPQFMNHALFYKYITIAREKVIPVIYCNSTNIDIIQSNIYHQCVENGIE